MLRLGRRDEPLGPLEGCGCQRRGTLEERGGGRSTAARARPRSRTLEVVGDPGIRQQRCIRTVPRSSIGIALGIGCISEGGMHLTSMLRRRRAIDGGPHQRMAELDAGAEGECVGTLRVVDYLRSQAEHPARTPEQIRIPGRVGGSEQQEESCRRGQRRELRGEALLDPAFQWNRGGE